MFYFKACPRCGGDVREALDLDGVSRQCVQCGYTKDLDEREHPVEEKVA